VGLDGILIHAHNDKSTLPHPHPTPPHPNTHDNPADPTSPHPSAYPTPPAPTDATTPKVPLFNGGRLFPNRFNPADSESGGLDGRVGGLDGRVGMGWVLCEEGWGSVGEYVAPPQIK
jgi:hypothetical protein